MRRVFIIRKDLKLKPGKLAAMVGHCCEAYWTNMMKASKVTDNEFDTLFAADPYGQDKPALYNEPERCAAAKAAFERGEKTFKWEKPFARPTVTISLEVPKDVWDGYVNDIFTKTICEARNKGQLMKVELYINDVASELGVKLVEGVDWGYINDKCLTDLAPENPDGTCTVGVWFKPLPDDVAHRISKKFPLYRD